MKQYWQKFAAKIDALTLRERVIIFAMLAIAVISLINNAVLDAQFAKQKQLSEQVKGQQLQTYQIQSDIRQAIQGKIDPDAPNRARLTGLKRQSEQMQTALLEMQKGLVAPDKMAILLEDILKHNARLQLLSLKTLPVTGLHEKEQPEGAQKQDNKQPGAMPAPAKPAASTLPAAGAVATVYKHGVEIVVQGEYLDMLRYMADLEAMPWQLFWGKAKLAVEEYPKATLTLTLYTLSLDKKWLNL